jgi:starch phosphorylase
MKIRTFNVLPEVPASLQHLDELARNLWFSWTPHVCRLFEKLDPESWQASGKNPVRMLSTVPEDKLLERAADSRFCAELETLYDRFQGYMNDITWFERQHGKREQPSIAYFSCEFGLHESLPIYSGGLGVLAGDHVKSASDLGLPLVGVGLFYRQGYFQQSLSVDGWQQEHYPDADWHSMPVTLVRDDDGAPVVETVELENEAVQIQVWRIDVGRVCIYMLDTNLPANSPRHRDITIRLYASDRDHRLRQEIILGIGGKRVLTRLGLRPNVYHINEGHSAFLLLERIRTLMHKHGLTYAQARAVVWSSSLFTTHTPVPAGHERFKPELLKRYLHTYAGELGLSWDEFLAHGREDDAGEFCMTTLALRLCARANGVSRLHGSVSRDMWHGLFPGVRIEDVPIGHVTNGVHARSWQNPQLRNLFLRYMGPMGVNELADFTMFSEADSIPDEELWAGHNFTRLRLVRFVRERLHAQRRRQGLGVKLQTEARQALDPNALTIGFARRFATYKRGALLLHDLDRLRRIVCDADRPVQLLFGGKAHPADHAGKEIIKAIIACTQREEFRGRIVFIENYDIEVARRMVQGVDVWLNTPVYSQEASGTSGMKAALNGGVNVSILDGWWAEAYSPEVGFAIGHGEVESDDAAEAEQLYNVLENEVIPRFYDRDEAGIPVRWVELMKNSIRELGTQFNTHRMVHDYTHKYYVPCETGYGALAEDGFAASAEFADWLATLKANWQTLSVTAVCAPAPDSTQRERSLPVSAVVELGDVAIDHCHCEVCHGPLDKDGNFIGSEITPLELVQDDGGTVEFSGVVHCRQGGHYGMAVRLRPKHTYLPEGALPERVVWA